MLAWEQHLKELPGRPSSSSSFSSLQLHENFSLKFSPPGFGIKLHHHKQFAVTLTALGKWEQYGRQRKKKLNQGPCFVKNNYTANIANTTKHLVHIRPKMCVKKGRFK